MIIIKLWGGIGNQLFQYVFGQFLKYRYNQEVEYDNGSFVSTDKLRKPELYAVNPTLEYNDYCVFSRERGIKNRALRILFQMKPEHHFIQEGASFPAEFKKDHIYFFQGYWQDIKYYKWLCQRVPAFSIKSQIWPDELDEFKSAITDTENAISIHVRRGDYFDPKNVKVYGVCDAAYFEQGLRAITKRIKGGRLFVFSDDLGWVKDNLQLPSDAAYIPNLDVSQFAYIELMSLCRHHIISNSSFSWWGAVLNEKDDAIVICPSRWTLTSPASIALDKWIKI